MRVDIHAINHDGNLIDACSVAAIAALAHFRYVYLPTGLLPFWLLLSTFMVMHYTDHDHDGCKSCCEVVKKSLAL